MNKSKPRQSGKMKPFIDLSFWYDTTFIIFATGFSSHMVAKSDDPEEGNVWRSYFFIEVVNIKLSLGVYHEKEEE